MQWQSRRASENAGAQEGEEDETQKGGGSWRGSGVGLGVAQSPRRKQKIMEFDG